MNNVFFLFLTASYVLVGNKLNLRDKEAVLEQLTDNNQWCVSEELGSMVAQNIGAIQYVESSASMNIGILKIFEAVVRAFQQQKTTV